MSNNLPPFYVGQRVVCVETSPFGNYQKGKFYTVAVCFTTPCCQEWRVGCFECPCEASNVWYCACGKTTIVNFNEHYWAAKATRFAPIQENFQSITLSEVLEKETPLISVN